MSNSQENNGLHLKKFPTGPRNANAITAVKAVNDNAFSREQLKSIESRVREKFAGVELRYEIDPHMPRDFAARFFTFLEKTHALLRPQDVEDLRTHSIAIAGTANGNMIFVGRWDEHAMQFADDHDYSVKSNLRPDELVAMIMHQISLANPR